MATFRLFDIRENRLKTFPLDDHPRYLATSHVWRENVFPRDRSFVDCFGGRGVVAVVRERYPDIRYCWFDTRCIDQDDEQDKLTQIPLMNRIYGQAECVIIFLSTRLDADQSQVDWLLHKIDGALAMCMADAWEEEGPFWQYGEGRKWLAMSMRALARLAGTSWSTRIWTLQEYVLARKVVWIGQDLQPIEIDDYVFSALPAICDTLTLEELLTPDLRLIGQYFTGIANCRMNHIDRTRVVELSAVRQATVAVDEVYGIMAASGVSVPPRAGERKAEVWARWCEEAVKCGHIRWILLPASSGPHVEGEKHDCIFPHFSQRHHLSTCSGLDTVKPLGPVSVANGTVALTARLVGSGYLTRRLGTIHEPREDDIHRDITLILFAEARWSLALQLVWVFGGGRYNTRQARSLAQVLVQSYARALKTVASGRENTFRPMISSHFQRRIWNDFMYLQQSIMLGLNHGVAYLCNVGVGQERSFRSKAVVVLGRSPAQRQFDLLDFDAQSPDGRSILMAVQKASLPDQSEVYHKIGMTLAISEDVAQMWQMMSLSVVRIGGYACSGCSRTPLDASNAPASSEGHSHSAARHPPARKLRVLGRQQDRVRLQLFATRRPWRETASPRQTRRLRVKMRRWRQNLMAVHAMLRKPPTEA